MRANDPRRNSYARVHILSIDTYIRRDKSIIDDIDFIIIDEAHEATAPKYKKLFDDHPDKLYLGLSATFQKVGHKYHTFWDTIIAEIDGNYLHKHNFLPSLKIFCPDIDYDMSKVSTSQGDYNVKEMFQVMEKSKIYSDFLTHFKEYGTNSSTICFCPNIAYAEKIHRKLQSINFHNSLIYHSKLPAALVKKTRNLIKKYDDGGTPFCIVSVDKVSKGFDLPRLKAGFMMRPTKSLVKYRQQVGRLTRGKGEVILIDMTKNSQTHGHPYELALPQTDGQAKMKTGIAMLKRCPKCYVLCGISTQRCKYCGFEFAPGSKGLDENPNVGLKEFKPETKVSEVKGAFKQIKHLRRKHNLPMKWVFDRLYQKKGNKIFNYFKVKESLRERNKSGKSDD